MTMLDSTQMRLVRIRSLHRAKWIKLGEPLEMAISYIHKKSALSSEAMSNYVHF